MANTGNGIKALFVATVLFAAMAPARAQYEIAEIPFFNSPPGTAALGGGLRIGKSLYRAVDNEDTRQLDLVPMYLYNGKWLFARGTAGGLHFVNRENFQFNLLARYRFTKLDPDRNAFYEGMEERKQTLEGGLELRFRGAWGNFHVNYLSDTLNRHQGQSADAVYRFDFDRGRFTLSPFLGWSWTSDKLTNYYYGVRESEARAPDRPAYTPGEAQWANFGLNTTYWVSDQVQFFFNLGFGGPDSVVRNSPLVEEDTQSSVYVGGTYIFGNVTRPDMIMDAARSSEWSWRVNYGYQAEENIVGGIDQGDVGKSTVADTNIGGVTLSKLISTGRLDIVGRLAAFRHFEEDENNGDFWSYSAYLMAMGRGFSRWSGEDLFRYGFGFGMSYAETVPIAEQRKQGARDRNTSKFLNYLEIQLDFPLRRLFKESKAMRNCYAGLTVVHSWRRGGRLGLGNRASRVQGGDLT